MLSASQYAEVQAFIDKFMLGWPARTDGIEKVVK